MRRMQEREDSNKMRRKSLKGEEGTKEEEKEKSRKMLGKRIRTKLIERPTSRYGLLIEKDYL